MKEGTSGSVGLYRRVLIGEEKGIGTGNSVARRNDPRRKNSENSSPVFGKKGWSGRGKTLARLAEKIEGEEVKKPATLKRSLRVSSDILR